MKEWDKDTREGTRDQVVPDKCNSDELVELLAGNSENTFTLSIIFLIK